MPSSHHFLEPATRAVIKAAEAYAEMPPLWELTPAQTREITDSMMPPSPLGDENVDARELVSPAGVKLVLFTPKAHSAESGTKIPIVFYIHGGGFIFGSPITHAPLVRALVTATGYAFAFPHYTLAPEAHWQEITEECYSALQWVTTNDFARRFGLDASRIAVCGDSAGGNLSIVSTFLSIRRNSSPKIAAAALIYPCCNMSVSPDTHYMKAESMTTNAKGFLLETPLMDWMQNHYAPKTEDRDNVLVSPIMANTNDIIMKEFPPTLMITVANDPLRDDAERFAEMLAEAGADVFSIRVQHTIHNYMQQVELKDTPTVKGTIGALAFFLKSHLMV